MHPGLTRGGTIIRDPELRGEPTMSWVNEMGGDAPANMMGQGLTSLSMSLPKHLGQDVFALKAKRRQDGKLCVSQDSQQVKVAQTVAGC